MLKVAPSIMCANSLKLIDEIKLLEECNVDMFHCDVMDGQYVDNIAMGFYLLKAIKEVTNVPLDIHLAVMEPEKYVRCLADIGVESVSVHVERVKCLNRLIQEVKASGMKISVALNPATPVCMIKHIIKYVDMILVMTVDPGFEGQTFIKETLEKIKKIRQIAKKVNVDLDIQVDGNINEDTIPLAVEAGANVLVLGTSVLFNNSVKDYKGIINNISNF